MPKPPPMPETTVPLPATAADWKVAPDACDLFKRYHPRHSSGLVANGTKLSDLVTLHHDGKQDPEALQTETGLSLTTSSFDGSFLSLAFGLTPMMIATTRPHHLIRLSTEIMLEPPCPAFGRLTLESGPNREEYPFEIFETAPALLEWDLHFTSFDPLQARDIWVDLIFNPGPDTRIDLGEVILLRHPRARF